MNGPIGSKFDRIRSCHLLWVPSSPMVPLPGMMTAPPYPSLVLFSPCEYVPTGPHCCSLIALNVTVIESCSIRRVSLYDGAVFTIGPDAVCNFTGSASPLATCRSIVWASDQDLESKFINNGTMAITSSNNYAEVTMNPLGSFQNYGNITVDVRYCSIESSSSTSALSPPGSGIKLLSRVLDLSWSGPTQSINGSIDAMLAPSSEVSLVGGPWTIAASAVIIGLQTIGTIPISPDRDRPVCMMMLLPCLRSCEVGVGLQFGPCRKRSTLLGPRRQYIEYCSSCHYPKCDN
jgi:hypothetical protein